MPPQFGTQPYSMGPVSRWDDQVMRLMPASGALVRIETPRTAGVDAETAVRDNVRNNPEISIITCLIAPAHIQRAARATGMRGIIRMKPRGLDLPSVHHEEFDPAAGGH